MMFQRGAWLGQIPLVLGPSSWGAGMLPTAVPIVPTEVPPYYGEWAVAGASGRLGPFNTKAEAFEAAARAATDAGATALPGDGSASVIDSRGQLVGPIT